MSKPTHVFVRNWRMDPSCHHDFIRCGTKIHISGGMFRDIRPDGTLSSGLYGIDPDRFVVPYDPSIHDNPTFVYHAMRADSCPIEDSHEPMGQECLLQTEDLKEAVVMLIGLHMPWKPRGEYDKLRKTTDIIDWTPERIAQLEFGRNIVLAGFRTVWIETFIKGQEHIARRMIDKALDEEIKMHARLSGKKVQKYVGAGVGPLEV